LARMAPVDIVLLDMFRRSGYPKVEVVPSGTDQALLAPNNPMVLAVTSEGVVTAPVPGLSLSDIGTLADFVMAHAVVEGNESSRQGPGCHDIGEAAERP
jgi:molybdopterin-guanine dinucleotide biosynthesis protein